MRDRRRSLFLSAALIVFAAWFSPTLTSIIAGTGIGVSVSSGVATVSALYGTTSGTATQGNDNRLPPTPSGAGKIIYDTGSAYAAAASGISTTVLHGGTTPGFSAIVVADIASALAAGGNPITGTVLTASTRVDAPSIGTNSSNQHAFPSGTSALVAANDVHLCPVTSGGKIYYDNGTACTELANGIAGQFLKSNGTTLAPSWGSTGYYSLLGFVQSPTTTFCNAVGAGVTTCSNSSSFYLGIMARASALSALYCRIGGTVAAGGNNIIVVVGVNGSSSCNCTITGGTSTCNNTCSTAMVAGDYVEMSMHTSSVTATNAQVSCSIEIQNT